MFIHQTSLSLLFGKTPSAIGGFFNYLKQKFKKNGSITVSERLIEFELNRLLDITWYFQTKYNNVLFEFKNEDYEKIISEFIIIDISLRLDSCKLEDTQFHTHIQSKASGMCCFICCFIL